MKKNNSNKIISMKQSSWDQFLAKLAIFVSILMVVGGAIGMILVQKDLKKSQDLRQQASVSTGMVSVTTTSTSLTPDNPGRVDFYVNTSDVQTDGVQLTFNIVTDTFTTSPVFTVLESGPFQSAYSEIEKTSDGYLVSVMAIPKQLGSTYGSSTAVKFGSLDFEPTKAGQVSLNFDVENSFSSTYQVETSTAKDELTHIATVNYDVVSNEVPDTCQSDADCSTGKVCFQPTNDCADDEACNLIQPLAYCTTPNEEPEATPDATPDAIDDPGIGGQTIATCNESCAGNADCDVNLRCYSGQCRLVTNVTSESCSAPADQGLSFSCNEYCSDSNECATGLTCYNNSCRNPENTSSTTCSNFTVAQRTSVVQSCNGSCSSNNDCDVNLRCYQGACRLATNPGSYSCSPATKKTISEPVYGGPTKPKGDDDGSAGPGKTDPNKVTGEVVFDKDLTMQDVASTDMVVEDKEETALDFVKDYFMANPRLPVILMGIGLGVVSAIILISLIKRKKNNDEPPMPSTTSGTPEGSYEQNLQSKINTLKKATPPTQSPVASVPPAVKAPVAKMKIPQSPPVKNTSGEVFSTQNSSSQMINNLKNKDITPPSV